MRAIYYMTITTVILTVRDTWTNEPQFNCIFHRNRTRGNNALKGKNPIDVSQYKPQNMSRIP